VSVPDCDGDPRDDEARGEQARTNGDTEIRRTNAEDPPEPAIVWEESLGDPEPACRNEEVDRLEANDDRQACV